MVRIHWMVVAMALCVAVYGCDDDEAEGAPGEAVGEDGAAGFGNLATHLDLLEMSHLADIDHEGIYIDFGSAAQDRYTVGDWKTGWGSRGEEGDTTFAYAGRRGRIYFHVDEPTETVVRLRLRRHGTGALTPYINNEQVQSVFFEGENWQDVEFPIPAEHMRAGENYLLLTFGGTEPLRGEDVSVALDSVRIVAGSTMPGGDYDAPDHPTLVSNVSLGGVEERAIVARRPTTLSWFAEIPEGAKLGFAVGFEGEGQAAVKVRVTAQGGETTELFQGDAGATWQQRVLDLGAFAGKIVRIQFVADGEGAGRVAWARPTVLTPPAPAREAAQAQNVVVLTIDTLRASKLRPYNPGTRVRTPNLDRIAEEGMVFERAQSSSNWTKPSVAGLLTGMLPETHGARTEPATLPNTAVLLSEHLKGNGFNTGAFVANGYVSERFGFNQGWDEYRNFIRENTSTEAEDVFRIAGDWVEQNHDERFFLYVQTIDPHVPYDPPGEYLSMYDNRDGYDGQVRPRNTGNLLHDAKRNPPAVTFTASDRRRLEGLHDGEITQHDVHMGNFLQRLDEMGALENTLFVVVSDHGEEFNDHGSWGHGHSIYQELLGVPYIYHLPGVVPQGRVSAAVSTMSMPATIVELMGVPALAEAEIPSVVSLMHGVAPSMPQFATSNFLGERRVLTTGRWKFFVRGNLTTSMFDLQEDPGEENQLRVSANPIVARYLRTMQGQFLGAGDKRTWLEPDTGTTHRTLDATDAIIDGELAGQLEALGYMH